MIHDVVIGVIGATAGIAAGTVIATLYFKERYMNFAAEEILEMREYFNAKEAELEAKYEGKKERKVEKTFAQPTSIRPSERVAKVRRYDYTKPPIEELYKKYNVTDDASYEMEKGHVDDDWSAEDLKEDPPEGEGAKPYLITDYQFDNTRPDGYSEAEYWYYPDTDILLDDAGRQLSPEMREEMVGEKNLQYFGECLPYATKDEGEVRISEYDDVINIRNEQYAMDIRVQLRE